MGVEGQDGEGADQIQPVETKLISIPFCSVHTIVLLQDIVCVSVSDISAILLITRVLPCFAWLESASQVIPSHFRVGRA